MRSIVFIISLMAWTSCQTQGQKQPGQKALTNEFFSLEGQITNANPEGKLILMDISEDGKRPIPLDTLEVKDGKFYEKYSFNGPKLYLLSLFRKRMLLLAVDKNQKITIKADAEDQTQFPEITGSSDTKLLMDWEKRQKELTQQLEDSINHEYEALGSDPQKAEHLVVKYDKRLKEINDEQQKFVLENFKNSIALLYISYRWDTNSEASFIKEVNRRFQARFGKTKTAEFVNQKAELLLKLAIGAQAPEIELQDVNGNLVKLSSLRGKYVLLDFWAGWCGPCRAENPNVVTVYNRYKSKGFEIYGVSLDQNRKSWVDAIAKDGLTWTNVSDLKYFNGEAARTYGINAIPSNFLLDKEGKIIGKNLRGPALIRKIEEIFGKI